MARPLATDPDISRRTAFVLSGGFLLLIGLPALHQTLVGPEVQSRRFRQLVTQRPTTESLAEFEAGLARESRVATAMRQRYQAVAFRSLGQGNDKVTVGHRGFLLLRQDLDLCVRPDLIRRRERGLHPSLAIIEDYSARLARRGVHLVVVPVPVAPALYPEKVWPGYPQDVGPATNEAYGGWLDALRSAGVDVVDVTAAFWKAKLDGRGLLFMERNSHWSPRGSMLAAQETAARVQPFLAGARRVSFSSRTTTCHAWSDLGSVLDLPPSSQPAPELFTLTQVLRGDAVARGDADAPVVLLGDSFAEIFSGPDAAKPCDGGGFPQHLMLALGMPIQVFATAGATPTQIRERLAIVEGGLRGKRVVVWEFTARFLLQENDGGWGFTPLPRRSARRRR